MSIFSLFGKNKKESKTPFSESQWIVEIQNSTIKTIDYEGHENTIEISEIDSIVVETNDTGPWGTEVCWNIIGNNNTLFVPGGTTGETEMLEYFQTLQNFNNEEFIDAMCSADNAKFICWEN
jgi:hypothetical protein